MFSDIISQLDGRNLTSRGFNKLRIQRVNYDGLTCEKIVSLLNRGIFFLRYSNF
jgi:hypothetical protein